MEFEIVLIPKLAPHYNFQMDKKTGQIVWLPEKDIGPKKTYKSIDDPKIPEVIKEGLTAKDWVNSNKKYFIDDKKVPEEIRNIADKELVNGIGKDIVIDTLKLFTDSIKYTYKNKKIYLTVKMGGDYGYQSWVAEDTSQNWINYIKDYYGNRAADTWMGGDIGIIRSKFLFIELFLVLESIKHININRKTSPVSRKVSRKTISRKILKNTKRRPTLLLDLESIETNKISRKGNKKMSRKGSRKASRKGSRNGSNDSKARPSPSASATGFSVGTIKVGNDKNKWIIVEDKNGTKRWKLHKKRERPSPSVSASLQEVGTKKKGGDGKIWIIVEDRNGVKKWKHYE
ncbi:hypothetical protein Indivirus_3_72 [Indivirus ILV1]|uniref:Uncharacterized protein n=1 Tax=Indivirus ILV1 TaxID=1977633 RepID=A0A1V0SDM7_9VIRU|nr:hypothetical protein Indivirus_3_72 [Indivirus ILV1]